MSYLNPLASIYLLRVSALSNHRHKKSNQGLTLLELLISGVIVGILSTIAIPAYVATVDKFHYGEAKLHMSCIKRELEAFRMKKGYFPKDVNSDQVPVGIECFIRSNTTLTPYNSRYDYENWPPNNNGTQDCVILITFFGKNKTRNSPTNVVYDKQPGFYQNTNSNGDDIGDDLILSLGLQPKSVCAP